MNLNHDKKARKLVNELLAKNGKTLREISLAMGYKQHNEVSKMLGDSRYTMRQDKLTEIIKTINPGYVLNVRSESKTKFRVTVLFVGFLAVVSGYDVDLTPKIEKNGK